MKKAIALIGCGRIACNAHLPAFYQMDDVRVKYVCDTIPEKAQVCKDRFPFVERAIADYKEALADPEIDAVYVLTPNCAHYTIAMDALAAGKHVFCEKPITINYAISTKMKQEADTRKKILDIGVCNRYHRSVEMLEQMYRTGEFGNIYHVYCSFRSCRSIPGLGGPFTTKEQSGGGVLIDWGIHFFDLILYVLGGAKIRSLTCDAYREMAKNMEDYKCRSMWAEDTADIQNGTNDVEDFVTGYIRTDKASISFNGAWAQNLDHHEMFIDFLGDRKGARLTYGGKIQVFNGDSLETVSPEYDIPDMYLCEDRAFIESISTGIKNRNNIDRILESAKLLDCLYLSAEQRKEIAL